MPNTKLVRIGGLALLAFLASTSGLDGQERGRGISGRRTFDAQPGGTLVLELRSGGSIDVEGWDRNQIEIVYGDPENDQADFEITFDQRSDGLAVAARYAERVHRTALRLEIRVPRRFSIQTRSAGGGIALTDLQGTFSGSTDGGAIVIHNVQGVARLSSGGGGIEIIDSELDGRVSTGGGEALVQNVVGDVRAISGGGDVQYRNVRDPRGGLRAPADLCDADITERTILITNAGGGITLPEAPEGACVRTGGGDIDVRGGRRFVHALTGGGDIQVRTESGDVTANTGAGEIEVSVERAAGSGAITLTTGLGDITLVVPRGFSARYDLTIGYTRSSSQDFRIVSDVDLAEERTTRWDSSWGSPRRFIRGTGQSGDGDYRIEIRTTNGSITVRER